MPVIHEALTRAGCTLADIGLLSVTSGPGLVGALFVGLQVAKGLSMARGIPLVGVNHLEGHLLAIRLTDDPPEPPFLGLVVSGGHTSLYEVSDYGRYRLVGSTRDDAAGERSEERRVGKECRSRWRSDAAKENRRIVGSSERA